MTMTLKALEILLLRRILMLVILLTMTCGVQCIQCKYINRVGSTYRLKCHHFDKREPNTAQKLFMTQNDNWVKKIIPPTQYLIVDNNTIEFVWQNIPRINTQIECDYHDERTNTNMGIFVKNVRAESPPEEIENFQCISYDFQYLRCSYDKVKQFQTETIISPSECKQKTGEENVCILSQPSYDSAKRQYDFTISSKNCFGQRNQSFSIHDLENVIPGKPNVSLASIRSNSAILTLTMHNELYKEKGLMYEIKLWEESSDLPISLNTSQLEPKDLHNSFHMEYLKAFRSYKVEVRAQTRDNNIVDRDMWGPAVEVTFKTLGKAPDRPPKIDAGSFFVDSKNRTHIFWETVPERDHNGSNFRYEISEVKKNGVTIRESRSSRFLFWNTSTTFYELPRGNYEFSIRSSNDNGTSPAAVLKIPEIAYPRPKKVRSFFQDKNYTICWNPPQTDQIPRNYTVFSCVSAGPNDATNKCSENFRLVVAPVDTKCVTFTSNKDLQFAVSANYHEASSGMVWVDCLAPYESDVRAVSLSSPRKNSSTISLKWSLDCIQKSLVTGYMIRYCRTSVDADDCSNKTINADAETVDLTGLLPYTEYEIRIALLSEARVGDMTESVTAKTSEGVPTAPKNLVICNITRNTVYLEWERPDELNGQLNYYKVWFNNNSIEITNADSLSANVSHILGDLEYNHVYNISVVAAVGNKSESERSNVVRVRTGTSDPGTASKVALQSISSSSYNITWQPGIATFSPVKVYEVKIENTFKNQSRNRIVDFNETVLEETFNCSQKTEEYQVYVRVLSLDVQSFLDQCTTEPLEVVQKFAQIKLTDIFVANNSAALDKVMQRAGTFTRILYGNWSAPVWFTCRIASSPLDQIATIVASSVILVVALLFSIWYARRRFVIAKNIFLTLPPALLYDTNTHSDSANKYSVPSSGTTEMLAAAKSEESRLLFNDEKDNGFDEEYTGNQSAFGSLTSVQLKELYETVDGEVPTTYLPMQQKRKLPAAPDGYILPNALDSHSIPLETCQTMSENSRRVPSKHLDSNGYVSLGEMEKKLTVQNPTNKPNGTEPQNSFTTNGYITHEAFNANGTLKRRIDCEIGMHDMPMSYYTPFRKFDSYGYMRNHGGPHLSKRISDRTKRKTMKSSPCQSKSSTTNYLPANIFDSNGYLLHDAAIKIGKVESANIAPAIPSCSRGVQNKNPEAFDASGYLKNRKTTEMKMRNKNDASEGVSKNVIVNGGYVSPALFQGMTNQTVD